MKSNWVMRALIFATAFVCTFEAIAQTSNGRAVPQRGAQPLGQSGNSQITPTMTDSEINEEALRNTQRLLRDPNERQNAIANDPTALQADQRARQLLGPNSEKAYELSAQLMQTIVRETNGDPQKMQKLILELQSNPHALEKFLTPAQRDMIRQMASDVEKSKRLPPSGGSER
jgi:hypothetical protein